MSSRCGAQKVRHMDIKWMWLQERVNSGEIATEKIDTDTNPADIGTKTLTLARIKYLLSMLSYGPGWGGGVAGCGPSWLSCW